MRAKRNQIYIGSLADPAYYFENDQIKTCPVFQAVALVGQELSIDAFNPIVSDSNENLMDILHFRSSDGQEIETGNSQIFAIDTERSNRPSGLIDLESWTPVWYYHNSELVGKFYISTVTRQAKNLYLLSCVSAIGMLQKKYHGGGLFQASTFGAVLRHILADGLHGDGNPVIDYEIDEDVASLPVSGWLPYSTKRENLYRLIFAYGVNIIKNVDGNPRFTFIYTAGSNATEIETSKIYNAGNVEYTTPYSKVSVMEHMYAYIPSAEPVTLFDNSSGQVVSNEEIWFDSAPVVVSTLATTGSLVVVSATENSAIITGNGELTGVPYTHSTRTVSRTNSNASEEKTVSVEDCTMVNAINSENLVNRLYAFYCPADFIKLTRNDIQYTDERCGKAYRFKNSYGEQETAFLVSMDIVTSSINKASCEWYTDYKPAGQEGLFQHVEIKAPTIDPDAQEEILEGDWEVPEGVTSFKVVLISGGTGGWSGSPGYNGDDARTYTNIETTANLEAVWYGAEGGDGGPGGNGGSPGRVKVVTFEDAVPGTVYHWTVGKGGVGGAATGFRPDTLDELRDVLENENPNTQYTDVEIQSMIAQEDTDWSGIPNIGTDGTDTTFDAYSTADADAHVPTGGVYEPITNQFFALRGNVGIRGGKGGARKVESNGSFNWVTDGEDVTGDDGTVYHGGGTGVALTAVDGLPEADIIAYGGNGAGAAVGIDKATHEHINGGEDQSTDWYVTEDD